MLRSAFDLYRFRLYQALRWELPVDTESEKEYGERLTEYLFRGTLESPVMFRHPGDGQQRATLWR